MVEQLITFKTAKLAKEKEFNIECLQAFRVYRDNIRKVDSDATALEDIQIEYEPYFGGCSDTIKLFNQSKEHTLAPSQSLLQKWLREEHNFHCFAECNASGWMWVIEITNGTFIKDSEFTGNIPESGMWSTYEEALEEGLLSVLKLVNTISKTMQDNIDAGQSTII